MSAAGNAIVTAAAEAVPPASRSGVNTQCAPTAPSSRMPTAPSSQVGARNPAQARAGEQEERDVLADVEHIRPASAADGNGTLLAVGESVWR